MFETQLCGTYHFIGHDEEVMFLGDDSDGLKLLPRKDFAHRVVRCVDNNHFGARRDGAASKGVSRQVGGNRSQPIPELIEVNGPHASWLIILGRRM